MATVLLPRHAVLIGDNNTGKTTLLEALDLVLGPDRLNRQPPIDEHDFFRGNYLAEDVEAAGVAVEDVGTDAEVGRVLAQDAVVSKNTNELKTRTPPISSLVRGDTVRRLMETKSERGSSRGLAYSVTCLTALRRGHAAPPNRREVDDGGGSSMSA